MAAEEPVVVSHLMVPVIPLAASVGVRSALRASSAWGVDAVGRKMVGCGEGDEGKGVEGEVEVVGRVEY